MSPRTPNVAAAARLERIGEDVSEKLDYTPGVFEVERHIRGKWVCRSCERLLQAPVPPHVIDKGIPTAGLLAQVLIAKYLDHAPLYRQESIFARAGLALPRSTLAQWVGACGVKLQPLVEAMRAMLLTRSVLHADETPVPMLKPGPRQNASGVPVELQHERIRRAAGRRLRLCREPRWCACSRVPRELVRKAGLRRLLRLQGAVRSRCDRDRLHGSRPQKTP